jgi:hypothetical protein
MCLSGLKSYHSSCQLTASFGRTKRPQRAGSVGGFVQEPKLNELAHRGEEVGQLLTIRTALCQAKQFTHLRKYKLLPCRPGGTLVTAL